MSIGWKKRFLLLTTPREHKNSYTILYWREKIFYYILFSASILGFLTLIPSVISLFEDELYIQIAVDVIVVLTVIYFVYDSKISFKVKSLFFILIIYLLAISLILMGGTYAIGGFIYLVAASILASIWRGTKAAIITLVFNTLTVAIIAYLSCTHLLHIDTLASNDITKWITLGANIFIVNGVSAVSVGLLIDGLERAINQTLKLKDKLSEEQHKLIEAKQKAEQADKLKTVFLGNMSHELKNPLNSIIGFSNLLLKKKAIEPEKASKYLKYISKAGEMLFGLINDILDITVIESGQLKIEKKKTSLEEIINEIAHTFDEKVTSSDCKNIEFNIHNNLGVENFHFETDAMRIKQVVNNLIKNAFKFTDEGEITFSYSFSDDKKYLVFSVKDTGIGIVPEMQAEIFNRFSKLNDKSNNTILGTGLGLAISKEIVELLGGEIWVKSVYGKGSTFYFTVLIPSK